MFSLCVTYIDSLALEFVQEVVKRIIHETESCGLDAKSFDADARR